MQRREIQPMGTKFDWRIFADATFAGLSVLIPIPIIDSIFEGFFRRRMPGAIAKARNRNVSDETLKQLGQGEGCSPVGCLVWPFKQLFNLLKKISKKTTEWMLTMARYQIGNNYVVRTDM